MSQNPRNARHSARSTRPQPIENGDFSTEYSVGTGSEAVLAVGVDSFFTDLPPASLVPFVRNRLWLPDPALTNNFPLSGPTAEAFTTEFNLFDVPESQSLILTYIAQTWLTANVPVPPVIDTNTAYTALPTTAGISGAAPLQITINQNPIADASGLYNDQNWTVPNTLPWYPPSNGATGSGFITQRTNCLYFGQHKVFAIIPEFQEVGALYTSTYGTAVAIDERPDAIHIVCKGFLAPTKVIQKARKLYGL